MPGCPACGRPVAVARATCLYCGGALPEQLRPVPSPAREEAPPAPERALVILDLAGAEPAALAGLSAWPLYDASRLVKRGGLQLHRALEPEAAAVLAARFRAAGIDTHVVPESEARRPPTCVSRAENTGSELLLQTPEGRLRVQPQDLLLIVTGPIARQRAPRLEHRRFDSAGLEDGWCAHLHRLANPTPLELDPGRVEIAFAVTGAVRLELESWLAALAAGVPRDDAFRRETPALAPRPLAEEAGAVADLALSRARAQNGGEPPPIYDNLAQFRFYSGWRGAVERRLRSRAAHGAC